MPEPVYERDTRRHVENLGNRTSLDEFSDGDLTENEEVIYTARINLDAKTVEIVEAIPKES